ncbi:hypothetical protein HDU93_007302 [Gonapodya sp. JEL0774]|nr:hypothetical protein HDU93_007302 [Gonapodya sp. JEL0774]
MATVSPIRGSGASPMRRNASPPGRSRVASPVRTNLAPNNPALSALNPPTASLDQTMRLIRHRLDMLDYRDPFDIESLPLISKISLDLVQTTESLRRAKSDRDRLEKDKRSAEEQVVPLRQEIGRLTAENNRLHVELIKAADTRDAREKETLKLVRKLETELSDARFMNSQYLQKIAAEQQRADRERSKVEELLSKMGYFERSDGKGPIRVPATKEKLFQRMQNIDLETGLEPMKPGTAPKLGPDPVAVDVAPMYQARVEALEKEVSDVKMRSGDLENEIETLRSQLSSRDQEIQRLGSQLEVAQSNQFSHTVSRVPVSRSPVPSSGVKTEPELADSNLELPAARRRIAQLETQVEYLQEHVEDLEKELSTVSQTRLASLSAAQSRSSELEDDLARERERAATLLKNLNRLEGMVNEMQGLQPVDVKRPGQKPKPKPMLRQPNTGGLDKTPAAKVKELEKRIKVLERELSESTKNVEQMKGDIECEGQVQERVIAVSGEGEARDIRRAAEDHLRRTEGEMDRMKTQLASADALRTELAGQTRLIESLEKTVSEQEGRIQLMQEEITRRERGEANANITSQKLQEELTVIRRERDEMLAGLQRFEVQITELHTHAEEISNDRDNYVHKFGEATERIMELQQKLEEQRANHEPPAPTVGDAGMTLSSLRAMLPGDREKELVRQVEESIGRNRDLTEQLRQERERSLLLEAELTGKVRELEVQRDGLRRQLDETEQTLRRLREVEPAINQLRVDIADRDKMIDELRLQALNLQAEKSKESETKSTLRTHLNDVESKLGRTEAELQRVRYEYEQQAQRLDQQRRALTELDRDRDAVRADADQKTETVAELQAYVQRLRTEVISSQREIDVLRDKLDSTTHQVSESEHEIASLTRQVSILSRDREQFSTVAQQNAEEVRNISADLATMTRENQLLNTEIAEIVRERDRIRKDLEDSDKQLRYLDDLVRSRDHEKDQLMTAYEKLVNDHDRLEGIIKDSSYDMSNARMEVLLRDKKVQSLQKALEEASDEIKQLKIDLVAFEKQTTHMARSLSTAEKDMRQLEMEKGKLLRDIAASRDFAFSVDRSKDDVQKHMTTLQIEVDSLKATIRRLEIDNEALSSQVRSERLKGERLEHLIAVERTKQFHSDKTSKETGNSQEYLVEQLQSLNKQQSLSLATVTKELRAAQAENLSLAERVRTLESDILTEKHAVEAAREDLAKSNQRVSDLHERLQQKERIIEEIILAPPLKDSNDSSASPSRARTEVERRILDELVQTKEQLHAYEQKIAKMSRSSSLDANNTAEPANHATDGQIAAEAAERRRNLERENQRLLASIMGVVSGDDR